MELDDEGEGEMLRTLPTDGTGKQIFPVISAQTGLPLAKNYEGRFVNAKGEVRKRKNGIITSHRIFFALYQSLSRSLK